MNEQEKISLVAKGIGFPALYENLAEEAVEVAKEALKCARIIRGENPTPVSSAEATERLENEINDFIVLVRLIYGEIPEDTDFQRSRIDRAYDRVVAKALTFEIFENNTVFNED